MPRFVLSIVTLSLLVVLVSACGPDGGGGNATESARPTDAAAPPVPQLVRPDGSYPTKPLEKDTVVVKVIQNGVTNLQEAETIEVGLERNLNHMSSFARQACSEGAKPDFLLFNEFPLTGYSTGTRQEKLQFTIQVPGPETERLGEIARECDTYIIFGSYAQDDEWPGHILSINVVIGRDGQVAEKYWKTRNIKRLTPGAEIPTTTIESVRDKYRARYGIEEEFPVLQTEYGNIAVSTVQLDPFVFAAFAMRGVEIMFRTSTLFSPIDVRMTAWYHNFYSAMSNITFPPDSEAAPFGGGSLIVSPRGEVLAEDPSNNESIIAAEIPIAEFRQNRRIPRYPLEVVAPVFEQYQQEVPLNHMDIPPEEMPRTREEMSDWLDTNSRWLNP
ncbi:MAG: nitrilase-related carbon-nitrogen hydrolase [Gammaproteobacteria bacterium]|nr:nitrilase-related carbon-nitrogen hydrolase [Gammaproteobacteria bacterium]